MSVEDLQTPNPFWFENGEWRFADGWHRYNPNNVLCDECDSWDVEWLWKDGEVVGFHCNKCGEESLDK